MPENIFNKNFRLIFSLIFLTEISSFLGYYYQGVNFSTFFAITTLVLILSLYKLAYGLFVLLAELFIGSFGYLFYFENGGLKISLRLALWLVIMSVWLAGEIIKLIKTKKLRPNFSRSPYLSYFLILFIFIAWGIINGFLQNNSINNIFFDANNWLYFLLVFPIFSVLPANDNLRTSAQIFIAATTWLSLKTLALAYIFSHNFGFFALDLYFWIRRSGAGEITGVAPGFSRIFMQSQIFVLIGIFVLLFYLLKLIKGGGNETTLLTCHSRSRRLSGIQELATRTYYFITNLLKSPLFLLLILYLSTIIISFSRSFWLGLAGGGLFVWLTAIFKLKTNLKKFIVFNLTGLTAVILSLTLTFLLIKFPYPKPPAGLNTADLLSERTAQITNEAGAASRWQLGPRLWQKIENAPLLGRGFGATVTYKSSDPRILATSPKGEYTTYAFEWGWLDIWLKLGIFGLLAYVALLAKIIFDGLKINSPYSLALASALVVLLTVNIFSPYVNHPLGIGYIILAAVATDYLKK